MQLWAPVVRGRKGSSGRSSPRWPGTAIPGWWWTARCATPRADRPRPEAQTRRRRGDRPAEDLGGRARAAGRLDRAVPEALRGAGPGGGREGGQALYSEKFACPECSVSLPEVRPACSPSTPPTAPAPAATGWGRPFYFDPDLVCRTRSGRSGRGRSSLEPAHAALLPPGARVAGAAVRFPLDVPFGSCRSGCAISFSTAPRGAGPVPPGGGGAPLRLQPAVRGGDQQPGAAVPGDRFGGRAAELSRYMNNRPCRECGGARLKKEALCVRVAGKGIDGVTALSVKERRFLRFAQLSPRERRSRRGSSRRSGRACPFLANVGLDYLNLSRASATLSGGEGQRIRLATQIGASLMGVLYILDEPSIGLHQRDNRRLLAALTQLRDMGNTVLVVEHDEETIRTADYVIDMGRGRGSTAGTWWRRGRRRPSSPARRRSRAVPFREEGDPRARAAKKLERERAADPRVPRQQPQRDRRDDPARGHHVRHGRLGIGEVDPRPGHPAPGAGPEDRRRPRAAGGIPGHRGAGARGQGDPHRPVAHRAHARAPTRRPTPACSRRSATCSRCSPRARRAATAPGATPST